MRKPCPECGDTHDVMDSLPKRSLTVSEYEFIANNDKFEDARTGNWQFEMVDGESVGTTKRVLLQIKKKAVAAAYFEEVEQWLITREWDLTEEMTIPEKEEMPKMDNIDKIVTFMTASGFRCMEQWDTAGRPGITTPFE